MGISASVPSYSINTSIQVHTAGFASAPVSHSSAAASSSHCSQAFPGRPSQDIFTLEVPSWENCGYENFTRASEEIKIACLGAPRVTKDRERGERNRNGKERAFLCCFWDIFRNYPAKWSARGNVDDQEGSREEDPELELPKCKACDIEFVQRIVLEAQTSGISPK